MSTRPTLTIEELAFEMFPDEIFRRDFQEELKEMYIRLMEAIAYIKNPIQRYSNYGWQIIYSLGFFCEERKNKDDFALTFLEPMNLFDGAIKVTPSREPYLDYDTLLQKDELFFFPSGVQPVSPKYFKRKIKFIDIKNRILILKYLECSPIILEKAARRFPDNGLIVVEINKILSPAQLVKPSSSYFPKLQKFTKKIQKILKEIELVENKTHSPPIN